MRIQAEREAEEERLRRARESMALRQGAEAHCSFQAHVDEVVMAGIERRRRVRCRAKRKARRKNAPGGVSTNVVVVTRGDGYQIPKQLPDPKFDAHLRDLFRIRDQRAQASIGHLPTHWRVKAYS